MSTCGLIFDRYQCYLCNDFCETAEEKANAMATTVAETAFDEY
jgi:hypothetical protein